METKDALQIFDDILAHLDQVRQRAEACASTMNSHGSQASLAESPLESATNVISDMSAWSEKATAIAGRVEAELGRSATALEEFLMETEELLRRWRSVRPAA